MNLTYHDSTETRCNPRSTRGASEPPSLSFTNSLPAGVSPYNLSVRPSSEVWSEHVRREKLESRQSILSIMEGASGLWVGRWEAISWGETSFPMPALAMMSNRSSSTAALSTKGKAKELHCCMAYWRASYSSSIPMLASLWLFAHLIFVNCVS